MKWKFIGLPGGGDIQIVSTESERDRFAQYCKAQRIRYGLVRVDENGVRADLPACSSCPHAAAGVREQGPER